MKPRSFWHNLVPKPSDIRIRLCGHDLWSIETHDKGIRQIAFCTSINHSSLPWEKCLSVVTLSSKSGKSMIGDLSTFLSTKSPPWRSACMH
jgi:hypothetical protein